LGWWMGGRDLPGAVWRRGCEDMVVVLLVIQVCVCCGSGVVEWLGLESSGGSRGRRCVGD
jgi:hypothetical protein